jgi:hypothetical protein
MVVKMFTSPQSPPYISQILPIHISDILADSQRKKEVCVWQGSGVLLGFSEKELSFTRQKHGEHL